MYINGTSAKEDKQLPYDDVYVAVWYLVYALASCIATMIANSVYVQFLNGTRRGAATTASMVMSISALLKYTHREEEKKFRRRSTYSLPVLV